jgi:CheY-like chemotaxis protein
MDSLHTVSLEHDVEPHRRVLVVDDYVDGLESWSLFLHMSGYQVLTAADGETGVTLASSEHPDVVVMDLDLPKLSGVEAARRLRASPETRDLPLIATTGYSQSRQLDEARAAGFDLVLVKPCDPLRLLAEIERLLLSGPPGPDGRSRDSTIR